MNKIFAHRTPIGFESYSVDHYVRHFILKLRYQLPRLGLAKKGVIRFLLTLEETLKTVHLIH